MTEQFAFAQQIQDSPVVDDLDRPRADHPQVLRRLRSLSDDRGTCSVKLNLRCCGNALDGGGVERVERRVRPQEAGDLRRCR